MKNKQEEILRTALQNQNLLTCYAYAILQDWADAKDAFQEMLIAGSLKSDSFKSGSIIAWLKVILKNKAYDILRSRKAEVLFADDELLSLVDASMQNIFNDKNVEMYERRQKILQKCLKNLRQDALDIILGFYRDRLSCDKLAEKYKRSTNSIWLTLSRSRKLLRQCAMEMGENSDYE